MSVFLGMVQEWGWAGKVLPPAVGRAPWGIRGESRHMGDRSHLGPAGAPSASTGVSEPWAQDPATNEPLEPVQKQ